MALIPSARYPGQTDTNDPTGYPHGKARNAGSYQDGTGFPFEKDWVNDALGFQQALLAAAGLTPNGTPDKVGASQYLAALQALATGIATERVNALAPAIAALSYGVYRFIASTPITAGNRFPISQVSQRGGFTIGVSNTTVSGPSLGNYLAWMSGNFRSASFGDPTTMTVGFVASGAEETFVQGTRHSIIATEDLHLSHISPFSHSIAISPDGNPLTGSGWLIVVKL